MTPADDERNQPEEYLRRLQEEQRQREAGIEHETRGPEATQPYGQQSPGQYGEPPSGPTQPPHQPPYGQVPHGTAPYGQQPYGSQPYEQQPYGTAPYGGPAPGYPPGQYATGPTAPAHPSAMTSMVLGVTGLAGVLFCLGITLVLSPFAWAMGARAVREIDANPGMYSGRDNANAGKVTGIIGTVLLVLGILAVAGLIALVLVGAAVSDTTGTEVGTNGVRQVIGRG